MYYKVKVVAKVNIKTTDGSYILYLHYTTKRHAEYVPVKTVKDISIRSGINKYISDILTALCNCILFHTFTTFSGKQKTFTKIYFG